MGGFLLADLGVRIWGGQGDLCPTLFPACLSPFCTHLALHTRAMTSAEGTVFCFLEIMQFQA